VTALAAEEGQRLRLVGWSLGGYLVREAARERPESVARIVTFGSPVVGGPKYTATAEAYRRRGHNLDAIEAEVAARERVQITCPITAIYTRNDGVVAWQACIDRSSPQVEHVASAPPTPASASTQRVLGSWRRLAAWTDARGVR
jgi:pimeloyl-ACP methyl ester carboxylesterase